MQSRESTEDKRLAHWDADVFRARCQVLAKNAMKGTGLSHDLFVEMFSGGVERILDAMPDEWRARAQDIAREFDYATRAELEKCGMSRPPWDIAAMDWTPITALRAVATWSSMTT